MDRMTLQLAAAIVDGALETGRAKKLMPLAVAVLDAGGHLVAFKREDEASILRFQIAEAKAWGALGMGAGGRSLAKRAQDNPAFFAALAALADGRMIPNPGGVLVRDAAGKVIGAVGISGDAGANDEACAIAAIQACGAVADPG
jgi:uncharacterized protein GlcG (DUF336 family)